jgi:hypothetical protein
MTIPPRVLRIDKDGPTTVGKTVTTLSARKKGSTPKGVRTGVKTRGGR